MNYVPICWTGWWRCLHKWKYPLAEDRPHKHIPHLLYDKWIMVLTEIRFECITSWWIVVWFTMCWKVFASHSVGVIDEARRWPLAQEINTQSYRPCSVSVYFGFRIEVIKRNVNISLLSTRCKMNHKVFINSCTAVLCDSRALCTLITKLKMENVCSE